MTLALYRRYRPETFAEVIGQEHVTAPLQQALRNDRVHHAYLFSGPRGCGKTTSARILARSLNCEQGPTPQPCGTCQSCTDLARTGPGSLDVVEIDAASHGGVDDARDLRERAFFAPASSRYKIYIVDEAHMVTSAGFNALLKVVEEPPPHLKFIFATTEPDKVIGTIRSRTHHYPFRLVPPALLRDYLGEVAAREQVAVDPAVLPLVVRAGAGSVRDALSILDQLVAGSGPAGVTYAGAVSLLGFTDAQLLDDVVEALAAGDGAAVFGTVERVLDSGHDPRRFVADLLERLRDLLILGVVPEAAERGLIEAPADQLARMQAQAASYGRAEVTRAADVVNAGLTEMRGATAPRLQLELICARLLLPGTDGERGLYARVDRIERRLALADPAAVPMAEGPGGTAVSPTRPAAPAPSAGPAAAPTPAARDAATPTPAAPTDATPARGGTPAATTPSSGRAAPSAQPQAVAPSTVGAGSPAGLDAVALRRLWPEVLEAVKARRRVAWLSLFEKATVAGVEDATLTLAFSAEGAMRNFLGGASIDTLRAALLDLFGVEWRIEAVLDPSRAPAGGDAPRHPTAGGSTSPRAGSSRAAPRPAAPRPGSDRVEAPPPAARPPEGPARPPREPAAPSARADSDPAPTAVTRPGGPGAAAQPSAPTPAAPTPAAPTPAAPTPASSPVAAPWPAGGPPGPSPDRAPAPPRDLPPEYPDDPHPDDPEADAGLSSHDLLARELGARVISEYDA